MEIDWSIIVSQAFMAIAKVVVPVLVALVLKWAVELWLRIKTEYPRLGAILTYVAQVGYDAAEEYFHDVPDADGESKMQYAVATALDYLKSVYGQTTDETAMENAINHYGVEYKMFSWAKDDEPKLEKDGEG